MNETAINEYEYLPKRDFVKNCPKCGSVFIESHHCDVCGYQLTKNFLGEPLGVSSFYERRETYLFSLNSIFKVFPFLESKISSRALEYKADLYLRLRALLFQLAEDTKMPNEDKKIFYVELRDLLKELFSFEVDKKRIWAIVNEFENAIYYRHLVSLLITCEKENAKKNFNILDYKVLDTFRLGALAAFFSLSLFMIIASYQIFSNLIR